MSEFYVDADPSEETVAEDTLPVATEDTLPFATGPLYASEEEIPLIDRFFQESWVKNEEAFLRRTEELIMLRSLLHGYELKPFVPLIFDKRTDVYSLMPHDLREKKYQYAYTLHPGSGSDIIFETNGSFYSICGNEVSYNHHSVTLARTPNVYDGSSVWISDNSYFESRDPQHGCTIINVTGKEKSTYIFHRHTDGVVRAHCKYEHFRYNGLLFERKRKGLFGPFIAMHVRRITCPSDLENVTEGEILLLKRSDNYIFRHNKEWYECRAKGVYHVRSNTKTNVQFPGLYGNAYYYDGRLYVTTQNHRFALYIFA